MPPEPLGNRTKMESTAALLPKQGSRAIGFGTDCEQKVKEGKKNYYKSQTNQIPVNTGYFQNMDNAGFVITVLVCVSNILNKKKQKKKALVVCQDTNTDLQLRIVPHPHIKSPTVHNFKIVLYVYSMQSHWISSGDARWRDLCRQRSLVAIGCLTHLTLKYHYLLFTSNSSICGEDCLLVNTVHIWCDLPRPIFMVCLDRRLRY